MAGQSIATAAFIASDPELGTQGIPKTTVRSSLTWLGSERPSGAWPSSKRGSDDDRRRGAWAQLHGHREVKIGLTTEPVLSFARQTRQATVFGSELSGHATYTALMRSRILALAICAAGVAACALPEGMNDECRWPSEPAFVIDLQDAAHRRHLLNDVRVAEELGVRFHDTYLNRGRGRPDWPLTRDDCDAALFESIGRNHHVTMDEIRHGRTQLSQRWDPFTYVPLGALYCVGAFGLSRWIRRRFANDEMGPDTCRCTCSPRWCCRVACLRWDIFGAAPWRWCELATCT